MSADRHSGPKAFAEHRLDHDDDAVPLLTEEVVLPAGLRAPGAIDDLDWVDLADRLRESVMAELGDSVTRMLSARMA